MATIRKDGRFHRVSADMIKAMDHTDLVEHLCAVWRDMPAEYRQFGLLWYPGAWAWCKDVAHTYGISVEKAVLVVAALSPQVEWYDNQWMAVTCIQAWKDGAESISGLSAYQQNADKAMDILCGRPYKWTAPKTVNFARLLLHPSLRTSVCVDSHSGRLALLDYGSGTLRIDDAAYPLLAQVYFDAADELGISAAELQAGTWEYRRSLLAQKVKTPIHAKPAMLLRMAEVSRKILAKFGM